MNARGLVVALVALALLALAAPAAAGTGLNAYKAKAKGAKQLRELKRQGFDITEGQRRGGIEIVATKRQIAKLRRAGVRAKLLRTRRGQTATRGAAAQAAGGWQVWRPYARTDVELSNAAGNPRVNIVTQLKRLARRHRDIAKLVRIGRTVNRVPLYAMKVTKGARHRRAGSRPAVLYSSVQHAREWLAGETGRRTLRLFLDNYGRRGTAIGTDDAPVAGVSAKELTKLVNTRELWFIVIANPDGYDFTFDPPNRLWRKNLQDNNGDGLITAIDGVDLNRNFPTRWNYDDEGSNTEQSSETFRGSGPASEPETRAFTRLMNRVHFTSNKNDHTFGRLLLWPPGWQVDTRYADEPIMTALAGDDENPAIPGFDPDVGAELYTTNGDTNDHMYGEDRVQSFTPEGSPGVGTGSGFIFQDVEADVQEEFEKHVQFALDLARSADNPSRPESHLGNEVPNFVVDDFAVSYGNPQTVQVNARRDLGRIKLRYQVNGGRVQTRSTREWRGGLRYGDEGDYWYHRMRGRVTGTDPGDTVKVWFTSSRRGKKSRSFTYEVRSDSNADVLVLSVEDYSGNNAFPPYPNVNGPFYLNYYTAALDANNVAYDVWNYDAENRTAPDPLGVLSHYDAVIWYTGNDGTTRQRQVGGVADLEAHRTIISVRDFVNEGGRVALAGVNAGRQYDLVEYPQEGFPLEQCDGDLQTTDDGKCQPLSNDFAQYYLGSYVRAEGGGLGDTENEVLPVAGLTAPLVGWTATLNADPPESAGKSVLLGSGDRDDRHAPGHVEHPRSRDLSAVRERPGGRLGDRGRQALRPAFGLLVHGLPEHQRGVQAPAEDDRPADAARRAARRPVVLHLLQHRARLGLRVRGGADAEGRRHRQRRLGHPPRAGRADPRRDRGQLRVRLVAGAPPPAPELHGRSIRTRTAGPAAARPPAPRATGTPPAATPAAGRSGTSTCRSTPGSGWSSPSCTRRTGAR